MATSTTPPPYQILLLHSTRATRLCVPRRRVLLAIAIFERIARAPFRRNLARFQASIDTIIADALLEIDLSIVVKRFIEDEIGAKARLDDLHDHAVLLELARITLGI